MERITTVAGLKSAIQILEVEQNAREAILKDNMKEVYESLKPVNILKNTIRELFTPNYLKLNENIAGTAIGAVGGFFLRKLLVGSSGNLTRKLLAKALQFTITKIGALNSDAIASASSSLFTKLFHKKKRNPEESVDD
jgi:hypothetical protein